MMRNGPFTTRFLLLAIGLAAGLILGLVLNIWFFFRLTILGYGDSGPQWIIAVNNWLWMISVLFSLVASQWYYHYAHKRGKL